VFDAQTGHGIGIDVLDPSILKQRLSACPALGERLFTKGEREYARQRAQPEQHLAARFCAKEAVVKALGLKALNGHEIEVVDGGAGVAVRLHGAARTRASDLRVKVIVSLSHIESLAGAVALVIPDAVVAERGHLRTADRGCG
jgi:holo-[acyl-carrier protein] synthase